MAAGSVHPSDVESGTESHGPQVERIGYPHREPVGPAAERIDPPEGRRAGTGRARPLPPDERRAALVAATLPLVAEHGMNVTTRQIADAAGVAEGTIFRVFPDKEALIRAAVSAALDPAPVLSELARVDPTLPTGERVHAITVILQRRLTQVFNLLIAVRMHGPPEPGQPRRPEHTAANEAILLAVVRLLEPDRARFRVPVAEVARTLRLLTFAGTHPLITDHRPMTAEEITAVLLDGVRRHPGCP